MILDKIAAATRERLLELQKQRSLADLRADAEALVKAQPASQVLPFEQALRGPELAFICEVKKASPSKGLIAPEFPYLQIACEYQQAGAAAVSVLTEPEFFLGSDDYLREISAEISLPTLRKDFLLEPYQIYEAKLLGAGAVLLICALLEASQLAEYLALAHSLGLAALVETHDEREVEMALKAGARVLGVNNRDLRSFAVDLGTSLRLRALVPPEVLFVSESGISTAAHIAVLREAGVDAVLIGETLMRAADKQQALNALRGME